MVTAVFSNISVDLLILKGRVRQYGYTGCVTYSSFQPITAKCVHLMSFNIYFFCCVWASDGCGVR